MSTGTGSNSGCRSSRSRPSTAATEPRGAGAWNTGGRWCTVAATGTPSAHGDVDGGRPDAELEHDAGDRLGDGDHAEPHELAGRADARVAGEGQLERRREDAHARVAVALGRQHERRLREVHLAGDGLHLHGA